MAQYDSQCVWMARDNITRFEELLVHEADACKRKVLEGLIVLEREKLNAPPATDR